MFIFLLFYWPNDDSHIEWVLWEWQYMLLNLQGQISLKILRKDIDIQFGCIIFRFLTIICGDLSKLKVLNIYDYGYGYGYCFHLRIKFIMISSYSYFQITKIFFAHSFMIIMHFATLKTITITKIFVYFTSTLYSIDCFHRFTKIFYNLSRKDYFNYQLLKILTIH